LVEDAKVGVRLKISALWIVLLFLYAYGDIFGFFKPRADRGHRLGRDLRDRHHRGLPFRHLGLRRDRECHDLPDARAPADHRPPVERRPSDRIATIVVTAIGESAYYWFLSIVEIAMLVLIDRYAWTWPRDEDIMTAP
jgi:hypothetical protein